MVYIKGDGDKSKARERFIVTKINGDSCTLQKIAKSQFRSKPYQLKLTEVYPVTSEIPLVLNSFSSEDSDSDTEVIHSNHDDAPALDISGAPCDDADLTVLEAGDGGLLVDSAPVELVDSVHQDSDVLHASTEATMVDSCENVDVDAPLSQPNRRSSRTLKPPS